MRFLAAIFALVPLFATAQTGKVEKIKGTRSVVVWDSTDVKAGDVVRVGDAELEASPSKQLRKRQHNFVWDYSSSTSKNKLTASGTTTTSDSKSGNLEFGYQYNWGIFEAGISASSSAEEDATSSSKSSTFGLHGQWNIITNRPGNDLIPYLSIQIAGATISKIDNGTTLDFKGSGGAFGIGLLWFPFSEIFALEAAIYGLSTSLESSSPSAKLETQMSGLNVGWRLVF